MKSLKKSQPPKRHPEPLSPTDLDGIVDTIVAQSSPPGSSAQAMIRLSGPDSFTIAASLLSCSTDTYTHSQLSTHSLQLPDWPSPCAVSVYWMPAPRTYTTEAVVEFHLPGSLPLVADLLQSCVHAGARAARPGEFTERAFLHGRLDLAQAEGVAAMIHARDAEEQQVAMRLLTGDFSKAIDLLRDDLLALAAKLELDLDFSDQDIEIIPFDTVLENLQILIQRLDSMIGTQTNACGLFSGLRVALVGPPNAGKSTLFNALLQKQRVVVSQIPGTTRDIVDEEIEIDGCRIHLFDTAGIYDASDNLTVQSVARTREHLNSMDAFCVLLTREQWNLGLAEHMEDELPPLSQVLWCCSQCDLECTDVLSNNAPPVQVSAVTGTGIGKIQQTLKQWFTLRQQKSGEYLVSSRNLSLLQNCRESLQRAVSVLQTENRYELVAADCREAMTALGEIVGEIVTDDILAEIFSGFCVGK